MPIDCAVSLDNVRTVPRALLTEPITRLHPERLDAICQALARATGC
jgi:mRNA-degrading endonuclease toxin of MazEF toxin-antitoxin module